MLRWRDILRKGVKERHMKERYRGKTHGRDVGRGAETKRRQVEKVAG